MGRLWRSNNIDEFTRLSAKFMYFCLLWEHRSTIVRHGHARAFASAEPPPTASPPSHNTCPAAGRHILSQRLAMGSTIPFEDSEVLIAKRERLSHAPRRRPPRRPAGSISSSMLAQSGPAVTMFRRPGTKALPLALQLAASPRRWVNNGTRHDVSPEDRRLSLACVQRRPAARSGSSCCWRAA